MVQILRQEGDGYYIHTGFHTGRGFATSTIRVKRSTPTTIEFTGPVSLDKILELSGFMELPFPERIIIFGKVEGKDYTIRLIPQTDTETVVSCTLNGGVHLPDEKAGVIDSVLIKHYIANVESLLIGADNKK